MTAVVLRLAVAVRDYLAAAAEWTNAISTIPNMYYVLSEKKVPHVLDRE